MYPAGVLPWAHSFALGLTQVAVLANPILGLVLQVLVLTTLVTHAILLRGRPLGRLRSALSVLPVLRLTTLSLPPALLASPWWCSLSALPILIGSIVVADSPERVNANETTPGGV